MTRFKLTLLLFIEQVFYILRKSGYCHFSLFELDSDDISDR